MKKEKLSDGFRKADARAWQVDLETYSFYDRILPFSLVTMDNGQVLLLASAQRDYRPGRQDSPRQQAFCAISADSGRTFSPFRKIPGCHGRPSGLCFLGKGALYFRCVQGSGAGAQALNFFSEDHGKTWRFRFVETPPPFTGRTAWNEGNSWVDLDQEGKASAVWEMLYDANQGWPYEPSHAMLRVSHDGGQTFAYRDRPENWIWTEEAGGKTYRRSVGEGSLLRAADGTLVAALRTDVPPRYFQGLWDDSLCGLAVSLSRDEGMTWSRPRILYAAGRHHPSLLRLPDQRLVMVYVVRDDMENGELLSHGRGLEALVSSDNGRTWDTDQRLVLDEFSYLRPDGYWVDGQVGHVAATLAPDGTILAAYGRYALPGCRLVRFSL